MPSAATAESLKEAGNAKYKVKRYDEAVQLYNQAIELDKDNAVLYSNRSVCQLSLGKHQAALSDAQRVCELRPNWEKGHFRKGTALEALEQLQQALSAYQTALDLSPMREETIKKVRELKQKLRPAATAGSEGSSWPAGAQRGPARAAAAAAAAAAGGAGGAPGPSSWAHGMSPAKQAEWLVDCYRIRLDDEYERQAMSGREVIKTRGRYDCNFNNPAEAKSIIAEDFLIFCKLAVQRGVAPAAWDWALFLRTAAPLLPVIFIFERSDCQKKWGYDPVMYSPMFFGPILRHVGEVVYGTSVLGVKPQGDGGVQYSIIRNRVLRNWEQLVRQGGGVFGDVGGLELWEKLHSELTLKQPTGDELMAGVVRTAMRQMQVR